MRWTLIRLSWLLGCGCITTCAQPKVEMLAEPWVLHGFVEDLDLSAIAQGSASQCLVVSDEGSAVQFGVIDHARHRLDRVSTILLPIAGKRKDAENDLEGAAFCEQRQAYYVIGSHGLGKKRGEFHENRFRLYEIPLTADGKPQPEAIRWTSLLSSIEAVSVLAPFIKKPLQQDGLNIEGLACAQDSLYVGLRAPSRGDHSFVLEVSIADLWQAQPAKLVVHRLKTGGGRGIRELVALKEGFIVLTGNSAAESSKKFPVSTALGPDNCFELFYWDGHAAEVQPLGVLPKTRGKAEGLLILAEDQHAIKLLVLFDSVPQGGAVTVRVRRKP